MNKQVTWGQLLGSFVTIALAIIAAWGVLKTEVVTLQRSSAVMEERMKNVETKQAKDDAQRAIDRDKDEKFREEVRKSLQEILINQSKK